MSTHHRNSLKPGYRIHWYQIEKVLGQGGFGITYLAKDTNLNKEVAIKEYLPIEIAVREGNYSVYPVTENHDNQFQWGLDRFLKEARTLAQFDHPNIVRVFTVFEENNTGYMVMNYESGQSLAEKLRGRKTMEEPELTRVLFPILGGLEAMHATGFIHRDIKPDNIFIREDGSPVLLDFGSARQAVGGETKTLTSLVTPGYAPFEQYYAKSDEQGPWTDIYGLGATLYRAISGIPPIDAVDRSNALLKRVNDTYVSALELGKGRYSERFLKAIDNALQFNLEDRPKTVTEWKEQFDIPEAPFPSNDTNNIPTQPGTQFENIRTPNKESFVTKENSTRQETRNKPSRTITFILIFITIGLAAFYFQPRIKTYWDNWQIQQEVHELMLGANLDMKAKRYIAPAGNNALEKYKHVLALSPGHVDANRSLDQIASRLLENIQVAISNDDIELAERLKNQMESVLPRHASTQQATAEFDEKQAELTEIAALEKERKAKLIATLLEANEKAVLGNTDGTLKLIKTAKNLGADEDDLQLIEKRLWLTLDEERNKLKVDHATETIDSNKQELSSKIGFLDRELANLETPQLTKQDEINSYHNIAMYSANTGHIETTKQWFDLAKEKGMTDDMASEITESLHRQITAKAENASRAAKRAIENKDISLAKENLKKAKHFKSLSEALRSW